MFLTFKGIRNINIYNCAYHLWKVFDYKSITSSAHVRAHVTCSDGVSSIFLAVIRGSLFYFIIIRSFVLFFRCCGVQRPLHHPLHPLFSYHVIPSIKRVQEISFLLAMFQFYPSSFLHKIRQQENT